MTRRHWLVLGLGGLIVSAASRVTAAGPVHGEAEAYGGSSVGQWTCGPTARATSGGVGGHVRVYVDDQAPKSRASNDGETQDETTPAEPIRRQEREEAPDL